jgi:hypothetical protein
MKSPPLNSAVLLLCYISTIIWISSASPLLDAAEKLYPDSTERQKNLVAALNTLKNMRVEAIRGANDGRDHSHKKIDPASVLCVSFVEPSFKHLAIAEYNMKVSSHLCDWGLLFVGADQLNVINSLERSATSNNVTLQFIEQSLSAEDVLRKFLPVDEFDDVRKTLGPDFKCGAIPKTFLLLQVLPYARKYNYVWLLDADITFEEFQVDDYFSTMRGLPQSPLLLQPVIASSDRPHERLNKNFYDGKKDSSHIAPSNIIEIMLPMIDSGFLVWFANFFVKPMMGISYAVGGDFGSGLFSYSLNLTPSHLSFQYIKFSLFPDLIWCRASALYLEIGLNVKDYRQRANSACIVITHTPIKHLDWDRSPEHTKDDSSRITSMYTHLFDGVKNLRYRFLPTKSEKYDVLNQMKEELKNGVKRVEFDTSSSEANNIQAMPVAVIEKIVESRPSIVKSTTVTNSPSQPATKKPKTSKSHSVDIVASYPGEDFGG